MAFKFEAINFRGFFIRHENFIGQLTRMQGPPNDFVFILESHGNGLVSFRSTNFPKRFLRHKNFLIRLEEPVGSSDQLFRKDSSFFEERGLADSHGVSYRSFNFPDHYLRHRNFTLFIEHKDTPNLANDATFFKTRAVGSIDEGANTIPVDE